ncbi:aspartate/glutamate racemase family protein [Bradyrhizobium huanghuaihaiense]|uniref:aspartate/glutamate racemase family protein n=1 Tax=Bradyrhizobium huanghuaihaiense TaxID=990078 RepID=UPI0021AA4B6B|nr:aspartate/glutamate racemase family protein [Bradyrhizobium sp. CB3035]UWU75896.1 aspartate/glutamate racemase family protein [Bradyrhizobium sp. CB3035]
MVKKTLGILELENEPITRPGFLAGPGTFQFPIKRIKVMGATTKRVTDGDRSVTSNYVECARKLESQGVAAIMANCGFAHLYQTEVAGAVSIPVALSSLLLVPSIAKTLPRGRKVGIVTYDANKLREDHFVAAGWSSAELDVPIVGIEGSKSWHRLSQTVPDAEPAELVEDVTTAVKRLLKSNPGVGALVFECTGFPIAAEAVRRDTGLPVVDCTVLGKMLVEISPLPHD